MFISNKEEDNEVKNKWQIFQWKATNEPRGVKTWKSNKSERVKERYRSAAHALERLAAQLHLNVFLSSSKRHLLHTKDVEVCAQPSMAVMRHSEKAHRDEMLRGAHVAPASQWDASRDRSI